MDGGNENIILELPEGYDVSNGFEVMDCNYEKPIIRIGSSYFEATLKETENSDIVFDLNGKSNSISCQRYVCNLIDIHTFQPIKHDP
ncbi:hypothetical protein EHI8A_012880 [Entamoeba histolytica HM-1:IMSS-B]|uniref:Uncharacterized protein n=3 Tax=Entamoeba TaxID=5758 RepID=M3UTN2_ENTH1|nr:hypothetical protein EHI8A_012880 [Entamoeba histolytica HM-1:IMSS-B]EMS17635.1 hypothetical protein KM1_040890 [Entamoeba histolytica HM-3:IMSS]